MSTILDKYYSIIKRFIPEKVVQPSVGLDIGTDSCKAVQVSLRDGTFEIISWVVKPILNGDTKSAVKQILEKLYLHSKNISTSVSGKGTLIRYIEMPKMPLEDLRNSVDIEADKHFPFSRDQIYTDCFILGSSAKNNNMPVLMAAAKKELIERRMKFLASLDIRAEFIGINSIAIANVFNVLSACRKEQEEAAPKESQEQAIAVLDIGHSISSLIIIKNCIPCFTRDIFIGGQDFNKRISNTLAVDMLEAQRIKCQPSEGNLREVQAACDSVLMNIASELRLSFDYFVTEKGSSISKLFLTGGSSMFIGVVDFFSKNLDMPVELWNPVASFKLAPHLKSDEINEKASQLGAALGLALYQHD